MNDPLESKSCHPKVILGFTIIELLVVIAIISLLSSIVLTSLQGARVKARDSKRVQDLIQLRNAIELYRAANDRYPSGVDASTDLSQGTHMQCFNCFITSPFYDSTKM